MDAYFEEWSPRVHVLRAPHNEEWGARTFDLLDPFGNTIFVMGPTTGHCCRNVRGTRASGKRHH